MWKGFGVRSLWLDRVRHVCSEMPRRREHNKSHSTFILHWYPAHTAGLQDATTLTKNDRNPHVLSCQVWPSHLFLSSWTMPIPQPIDFHYVVGPDVFLLSTRGQGAVRQQPWREIQDKTAPLPAATAWQRGECDCSCSQPLLATLESLDCRRTVTEVMVL